MNYHIIIEKGETRYLKTKVDSFVIELMFGEYSKINKEVKNKEDFSFTSFLISHGIECVYDGTIRTFNIDGELANS